jgi:3-isopropylmalate/(R)-2-methylmalate dehydratase large subunit
MGQTISEKILSKAAGRTVIPGEVVTVQADLAVVMEFYIDQYIHDLNEIGADGVWDADRVALVMDHRVPAANVLFAEKQKVMRQFAKQIGAKNLFDIGRGGISHRITSEMGLARPGILYAADDTHAPTVGAMGCYAVAFLFDIIEILATGRTWLRVPETVRIDVRGKLPPGVSSRDLAQKLLSDLGSDGGLNKVLEFTGPAIADMSMDARMTLCNLVPHVSAESAIINPDEVTLRYTRQHTSLPFQVLVSDADATYSDTRSYNAAELGPVVAAPPDPRGATPIEEVEGTHIDQAYIGSCANGGLEDLEKAAAILQGRKVHPDARLVVVPATQGVFREAAARGILTTLVDAGAIIGSPGCGACPGGSMGLIASDEVCISTSTLNITGRMGSPKAKVFLASPEIAAASALEARIADPRRYIK